MNKIIVNISNYTNYEYDAYLQRGQKVERPNDSIFEVGQVVYETDNNAIGVVLGCIDEKMDEIVRTDMNGIRSIDTVRPATMEDFDIEGVNFQPRLKAECEGKKVSYDWETGKETIEP